MQRSATAIRSGFLALLFLFLVSPLVQPANAQDNAPAPTTPNSTQVAKAQPSSPDSPSQRVAPVKPDSYIIGAEDILTINVWKEQEMSRQVPVRPDGMISLPLLGDVKASGLTPLQLQDQLTTDMKKYISDPQITVIVNQVNSLNFNVVGEVLKPGYYPLTRRMTILDAIAISGGFRDFAKTKKIYVLRTQADGKQIRIPFNYKNVIRGKNSQQNIELQPRDTLVVP
jgi:polysaccharide export outer membrane protein